VLAGAFGEFSNLRARRPTLRELAATGLQVGAVARSFGAWWDLLRRQLALRADEERVLETWRDDLAALERTRERSPAAWSALGAWLEGPSPPATPRRDGGQLGHRGGAGRHGSTAGSGAGQLGAQLGTPHRVAFLGVRSSDRRAARPVAPSPSPSNPRAVDPGPRGPTSAARREDQSVRQQ